MDPCKACGLPHYESIQCVRAIVVELANHLAIIARLHVAMERLAAAVPIAGALLPTKPEDTCTPNAAPQ